MDEECLRMNEVTAIELSQKADNILRDKILVKNAVNFVKEFKLYPADEWSKIIISLIFADENSSFLSATMYDDPYLLKKTKNCAVDKRRNNVTKEEELFIKIYPDTSLDDIKKSWKVVMAYQSTIRRQFSSKRYYPHKNLQIAKRIKELDTRKMSDWEKQQEIYGEDSSLDFGKNEKKRKVRIRQIRHRIK